MNRYRVKPEEPREDGNAGRFFILDTSSTSPFPQNLKRGRNGVLLGYRKREDAERSVKRLNRETT